MSSSFPFLYQPSSGLFFISPDEDLLFEVETSWVKLLCKFQCWRSEKTYISNVSKYTSKSSRWTFSIKHHKLFLTHFAFPSFIVFTVLAAACALHGIPKLFANRSITEVFPHPLTRNQNKFGDRHESAGNTDTHFQALLKGDLFNIRPAILAKIAHSIFQLINSNHNRFWKLSSNIYAFSPCVPLQLH